MLCRVLRLSLLLVVLSLIIFPSQVLAAGIGVTPGKMEFNVRPGGMEAQTLRVINQSNEESLFQVYVEGEYEEWFKITPSELILSPQETRGIEIAVAPPLTVTESHDFSICVVSLPPDYDLRLGVGIKVAAHVQILEYPVALILGGGIATLALIVSASILIRRRRKAHNA